MENFKFDLTNRQVCFLHSILEDYVTRFSNRAFMLEKMGKSLKHFDSALIDITCLCAEFDIQTDKYLRDNGLDSFVYEDDVLHKFQKI